MDGKLKVGESMDGKDTFSKEKWSIGGGLKNTLWGSQWEMDTLQKSQTEMLQNSWRNSKG